MKTLGLLLPFLSVSLSAFGAVLTDANSESFSYFCVGAAVSEVSSKGFAYDPFGEGSLGVGWALGGNWTSGTTRTEGSGVYGWYDTSTASGRSIRLMAKDDCSTWIETRTTGESWISFDWKTSCEQYYDLEIDRIEFSIDGNRVAWMNGETDWTNCVFAVRGSGEHVLRWTYIKDESEAMGDDCAWVSNVSLKPKTMVASPIIRLADHYETESTLCTIECETADATIFYKLDYYGDDSEWILYKGSFEVTGSVSVISFARKSDYYDSKAVSASCERAGEWTLAECVNAPNLTFVSSESFPWFRTTEDAHAGLASVRSGGIGDGKKTWIKTQMIGPGTISFWWKADSEFYKKNLIDKAIFTVDGEEVAVTGGTNDWERVEYCVSTCGLHTYMWSYVKNNQNSMGEDCVWIDDVSWSPDLSGGVLMTSEITKGTEFVIDTDWIGDSFEKRFGEGKTLWFQKRFGSDLSAALLKRTGKVTSDGLEATVWQDYIAGTDPTDKASKFIGKITMKDGAPQIAWTPDLNEGGSKALRHYKIWGKEALDDGKDWQYPTNALHHFFKVTVEMLP